MTVVRLRTIAAAIATSLILPMLVLGRQDAPRQGLPPGKAPQLEVPARTIPVPATVSPALQQLIARGVAAPTDPPTTVEEWSKLQATRDAATAKYVEALAQQAGATIEPVQVAGVSCYRVTPQTIAPGKEDVLVFHVHGGAFVFNGGVACTWEAILLAHACQARVLSIDYRMPPDHPFPAAVDDVLAAWKKTAAEHNPRRVVMGGTSAGGNLILTTVQQCRKDGLPIPAAIFLGSPGADLTKTGDSIFVNAEVDNIIGRYEGRVEACLKLYANGRDLREPLLSPMYGDFSGFPPTILVAGTRDLLLSDTARVHRKLRGAGAVAELHVFEGMSHAEYLLAYHTPEGLELLGEIAAFFNRFVEPEKNSAATEDSKLKTEH
jgi:acetyl esterase/lipase